MKVLKLTVMFIVVLTCAVSISNATLINYGNGMIYDDVTNVTWLQDSNYAKTSGYHATGDMTWYESMAWVDSLVYNGHEDWRLPIALNADASPCDGYSCSNSEIKELLNRYLNPYTVTEGNPFETGYPYAYMFWTSTTVTDPHVVCCTAWKDDLLYYNTPGPMYKDLPWAHAWAVADGNIADAPVPEPSTMILLGSGLFGLAAFRKKIRKK